MKKYVKFTLYILALFSFLIMNQVNAGTKCKYHWVVPDDPNSSFDIPIDQEIILETGDGSNVFSKAFAKELSVDFSKDDTIKLNSDGTCPTVYFYQGNALGNKVYSSLNSCKENTIFDDNCSEGISGELVAAPESGNNILGNKQGALVAKNSSICKYRSYGSDHTITINVTKDANYGIDIAYSIFFQNEIDNKNKIFDWNEPRELFFKKDDVTFYCPSYIYYNCVDNEASKCTIIGAAGEEDKNTSGIDEETRIEGDSPEINTNIDVPKIDVSETTCTGLFSGVVGDFLRQAFGLIRFAVPLLIIGYAIVDFVKAIAAHDQDEVKKAANKLMQRVIIGVVIFVLPTLIDILLKLAGIEYGICLFE